LSTLSPLPGFRHWLTTYIEAAMTGKEQDPILNAINEAARLLDTDAEPDAVFKLPNWSQNQQVSEILREPLLSLCARYLHEQREKDQAPLDPVARFHLGNGARIERINWFGDTSAKGMQESCGLMVNYLYHLKEMEQNIEAYATNRNIAAAKRVRSLLRDDEDEKGQLTRLRRMISLRRSNGSNNPAQT
jgi:malonyl-CoA decarboxylase